MWDLIGKCAVTFIVGRVLFSLMKGIYSGLIAPVFRLNMNLSKTGKWAVITGATDGIGKAYAFALAQAGLNVVLISRTQSKLDAVETEIKKTYPVETKTVAADFTKLDIYERIALALKDLDIGVLVNNVGMSYEYPEYITKIPNVEEFSNTLLNINIQSVNRMTMIVLPGMEQRRRGVIINISSLSAALPTPFLTLYAATKAYVESFSRNLDLELSGTGVAVQCVIPGFVATKLAGLKRSSLMVPTPRNFVKQAIGTLGIEKRTAGYFTHKLIIYGFELMTFLLPGSIASSQVYNTMKTLRSKALRKKEREAKAQ